MVYIPNGVVGKEVKMATMQGFCISYSHLEEHH